MARSSALRTLGPCILALAIAAPLPGCNRAPEERAGGGASAGSSGAAGSGGAAAPVRLSAEPGETVAAFRVQGTVLAPDGAARTVEIDSRKTSRPTAYVFVGAACPTTAKYVGRLAQLEEQFAGKVDFVFLYPNRTDSSEAKLAFHRKHGFRGPLVDDQGARISLMLGGQRTAEVVVVEPKGTIVYRGAIDDSRDEAKVTRKHLAIALDEHLAGKPVSTPRTVGSA